MMTPAEERIAIAGAAKAFRDANPDYRRSTKTLNSMIEFIDEHNLTKTDVESWQQAYDHACRESVGYSTGKFRGDSSPEVYLDEEAIDKMPADTFKERLREPIFARGVNLILGDKK
jgi:hypothetical protein